MSSISLPHPRSFLSIFLFTLLYLKTVETNIVQYLSKNETSVKNVSYATYCIISTLFPAFPVLTEHKQTYVRTGIYVYRRLLFVPFVLNLISGKTVVLIVVSVVEKFHTRTDTAGKNNLRTCSNRRNIVDRATERTELE